MKQADKLIYAIKKIIKVNKIDLMGYVSTNRCETLNFIRTFP